MYHKWYRKGGTMGKYKSRSEDFTKLTIRVNNEELFKFKKLCQVFGISANNQINILIRQTIYQNRNLFDQEEEIIDFWDEKNCPK